MPITKPFLLATSCDGWYPWVLGISKNNHPKESIILALDIGFGFVAGGNKRSAHAWDGFLKQSLRNFAQIYLEETVSF